MAAKVPTIDSGTATLGMMVAYRLRRNRKITITTRAMVSINSNSTSATDALMSVVKSVRVVTSMPAGRLACSCGINYWMLLTTLMVLAPGCRCTLRITAGVWFIQAACLVFSTPSTMLATSCRKTGALLR